MVQIIPAVLATSEEQYSADIAKLASSQSLSEGWVHIDFMDNKFVPNLSISPSVSAKYQLAFKKEAHLMVSHPSSPWINDLEKLGFQRIIMHLESDTERWLMDNLRYLEDKDIESGLAINPQTQVEKVLPFKNNIDLLLILGVHPGFQKQQFIPETVDKVKKAAQLFKGKYGPKIAIDGGINNSNVKLLADAGADVLIVGSYLLQGDIDKNLEALWENING